MAPERCRPASGDGAHDALLDAHDRYVLAESNCSSWSRPPAVERLWRAFREGAPGMYWSRVWSVYVYIRWCHRYRVLR
jgi:hypothetical protein